MFLAGKVWVTRYRLIKLALLQPTLRKKSTEYERDPQNGTLQERGEVKNNTTCFCPPREGNIFPRPQPQFD